MPSKSDYIDDINNNLRTLAESKIDVDATDIGRAAQTIDPNSPPDTPVTIYDTVQAGPTVADIPSSSIRGIEIKTVSANYTKVFARVRKIQFTLAGNVPPAGTSYFKYARVVDAVADGTYVGPGVGSAVFSDLDPGEPISDTNYDNIIVSLQGTLTTHFEIQAHSINYCHSSCHSNCHASRGRR